MTVYDTFMFRDEFDILECRLVELDNAVDYFVLIEADVDHQDHPKPYHYAEQPERFAPWHDRIINVRATGLPTAEQDHDPWAREHAQREWAATALTDAAPDDVILHGDIDEIPTALVARNVKPQGMVAFDQRAYFWAVDWHYPPGWRGTVAARKRNIQSFGAMRDTRNIAPPIFNAGWHLSWLGGREAALTKLGSFCHPEVKDRIDDGLADGHNRFLEDGWHVDRTKLVEVDVDATWPKWIVERRCPANWFRPR